MKILFAESNERSQAKLRTELSQHHFIVDVASDGETAWGLIQSFVYDIVLLDASLPRLNGVSICRRLREIGSLLLVILMVEAGDRETLIQGLNLGADDCLMKPIDLPELLARIRVLGRRGLRQATATLDWGPVSLNPISLQVFCNGKILWVSRKEYQILELFLRSPRQMFPRSEITDRLWNLDDQLPMEGTVKTHIHGIRRKLEQAGVTDFIQTQYGYGYRLNPAFDHSSGQRAAPKSEIDSVTNNTWYELMAANARLHQEVEERRRVEAELRRSETLLRNAQKAAKMGSWEFDLATLETYWTEELYQIHGLDPSLPPPTDQEVLKLIYPEDLQRHEEEVFKPAMRGEFFDVNLRIVRQDGEIRYINARGGPVFDPQGRLIKLTGTTFDITDWQQPKS